jgi:hypothetical protein
MGFHDRRDHENSRSTSRPRVRSAAFLGIVCVCATASFGQFRARPVGTAPELFWQRPPAEITDLVNGSRGEIDRVVLADGMLVFVRHRDGSVALATEGTLVTRMVNILTSVHDATPLETFMVLAPPGSSPHKLLVFDHAKRGGATVPLTDRFPTADELSTWAIAQGNGGGPASNDPLCNNNWFPDWEFFTHPDYGLSQWDNHDYGAGRSYWTDANLTLGPSRAGTMWFCAAPNIEPQGSPTQADSFDDLPTRLIVQEYVPGEGWFEVWSRNSVDSGSAYGYTYDGFTIHQMRMAIRDVPVDDLLNDWYWAGAY